MADETLPKSKAELMSLIEHEWSALMDVVVAAFTRANAQAG